MWQVIAPDGTVFANRANERIAKRFAQFRSRARLGRWTAQEAGENIGRGLYVYESGELVDKSETYERLKELGRVMTRIYNREVNGPRKHIRWTFRCAVCKKDRRATDNYTTRSQKEFGRWICRPCAKILRESTSR